ncbi:MAG: hypothetical protein WBD81_21755 [Collimonas pratensis]|uniref:hypothetical protein n=1 Tax=Collimonas pratensis TaxID=279113 RepID=UPI003C76635A
MKFGNLKSLGHNLADSIASSIGLFIGVYEMNIFAEAAASNEGYITVNFLSGTTIGAIPSESLSRAICLYRDELPRLCVKHGIDVTKIKTLEARFGTDQAYGPHFKVTVETLQGKTSTDQYVGLPGKRLRRRKL